ncbi:MAG: RHS repeat protein [Acidobacteria bacterium]|nr:RHS repeat protein [Acidobacteriota bacterium]
MISRFQSIPVDSSRFQSIPVDSSRFQSIPVDSSRFQSIPVDLPISSRFQSIPADSIANCNQSEIHPRRDKIRGFFVFARHGYKTGYSYDTLNKSCDRQSGRTDAEFHFTVVSRLLSAQNPESGTISYAYDPNGNLTSKQDARSITTSLRAYDAPDRVTQRSYDDNATPPVHYTYDDPSVPFRER